MLAVDAAHWPLGLGYFYRSLLDNAIADPFGTVVTLGVGLFIGRKAKLHHKIREFLLRPVHERLDQQDQQLDHHRSAMEALHRHLGVGEEHH